MPVLSANIRAFNSKAGGGKNCALNSVEVTLGGLEVVLEGTKARVKF